MKLVLGMVVGLSPAECVLDGEPTPSLKRGRVPSPILRVEVRISKLDRNCGALLVVADFVDLEQQIILVKTRSESVSKWRRYNRLNFGALLWLLSSLQSCIACDDVTDVQINK